MSTPELTFKQVTTAGLRAIRPYTESDLDAFREVLGRVPWESGQTYDPGVPTVVGLYGWTKEPDDYRQACYTEEWPFSLGPKRRPYPDGWHHSHGCDCEFCTTPPSDE